MSMIKKYGIVVSLSAFLTVVAILLMAWVCGYQFAVHNASLTSVSDNEYTIAYAGDEYIYEFD